MWGELSPAGPGYITLCVALNEKTRLIAWPFVSWADRSQKALTWININNCRSSYAIHLGQATAGAAFGGTVSSGRRKRDLRVRKSLRKDIVDFFPGRAFGKKKVTLHQDLTEKSASMSTIRARVKIPFLTTFTLCFWIRTKDDFAQIIALIYNDSKNKARIDVSLKNGKLVLSFDGKRRYVKQIQ